VGRPDPVAWALGLAAAVVAAGVLAHRHLSATRRKPLRELPEVEPPPEFVDG
jgi:hypothetical protein